MSRPKRQKKRVREMIPPEVRQRTRSAGLPEADWYAGRPYERVGEKQDVTIGGEAGWKERSEAAMAQRRREARERGKQRVRRMVARISGLLHRLRHPRAVQPR